MVGFHRSISKLKWHCKEKGFQKCIIKLFMHFNVFVQPFFSAMELVLKLMQVTCVIYFFFFNSSFVLEGVCRDCWWMRDRMWLFILVCSFRSVQKACAFPPLGTEPICSSATLRTFWSQISSAASGRWRSPQRRFPWTGMWLDSKASK